MWIIELPFRLIIPGSWFGLFFRIILGLALLIIIGAVGGTMALEDATVPHPDNHHGAFEAIGCTVAMVETCQPFHGWTFKAQDGRQLKICDLGNDGNGKQFWAVNIKRADGSNITSIPKFGMKVTSLVKYVWNTGYSPLAEGWGSFILKVIAEFGL